MSKLLQARDDLAIIGFLNESIYMAAAQIGEPKQASALQALSEVIDDKIDYLKEQLAGVREAKE